MLEWYVEQLGNAEELRRVVQDSDDVGAPPEPQANY